MAFPRLCIHRDRILYNAQTVVSVAKKHGISVFGVTKGVCAHPEVARAMLEGGCVALGDSRLANIRQMREAGVKGPFVLIRIPMPSEIDALVDLAEMSLVSMPETVELIDEACKAKGKTHRVIVMVDVGDLREGIWPDEVEQVASRLKKCARVEVIGVGTNLGCTGGVMPSPENMRTLIEAGGEFERILGKKLEIYSGGSSNGLDLLEKGTMPEKINNLRMGAAILLGIGLNDHDIPYLRQDTMEIQAEVVEVRRKPSVPIGETGLDAFGHPPVFVDRGIRLRAILALGRQDVPFEALTPLEPGIELLASSSDHLILDVEDHKPTLKVGDVLSFKPGYGAMLAAATSSYVEKVIC